MEERHEHHGDHYEKDQEKVVVKDQENEEERGVEEEVESRSW